MQSHFNLTDTEFEKQFQDHSLDPALFNHEAHVRLAWIHIKKYGVDKATENICEQLISFVNFLKAYGKYNITLTVAAVKIVDHFIKRSSADNFEDFIHEFPRLKYNFKELVAQHYKMDIYNSPVAKEEYVEPDLLPFE